MKPIVLGSLSISTALIIAVNASADIALREIIIPGPDRSVVVARLLPSITDRAAGYPMTIRVYSGYPGGATLMQRFSLWRGKPVDIGFSYTKESGIHSLPDHSCFGTYKKVHLMTSSYRVFTAIRNTTETMTGRTLIHQYYC